MKWYPWYPVEFRRDTLRLSLAEEGAYRRLLDEYMITRGSLPDDDMAIARIVGVGMPEWQTVAPAVRSFFKSQNGKLIHKRCEEEIRVQDLRMEQFSERGKKAAFARYSKINHINARRMLVPATEHNITKNSSNNSDSEIAERPKGVGVSRSLGEVIRERGWTK